MIATFNTPEAQVYLIQRGYLKQPIDGNNYLVVTIDAYDKKIYPKMYVVARSSIYTDHILEFDAFKLKLEKYEKKKIKDIKLHHEWNL